MSVYHATCIKVEGAKYIFEAKTIRRMELLVLGALDWRLRSVTPFNFLSFFACKLDSTGAFTSFLISRATEIILSNIQGLYFHNFLFIRKEYDEFFKKRKVVMNKNVLFAFVHRG